MTTYSTTQTMMTLAAFAATGATPRPSGETPADQQARIILGITAQLALDGLATQGNWSLVWVGLTQSGANLAYIAQGPNDGSGASVYALVLRGTVGGSPIDTAEDMQVGLMLPFLGGTAGNISQGAMEAFTDIVMGTDLVAQLKACNPGTLNVVGHSLGGAMVTTLCLYLWASGIVEKNSISPYTFAAPTAGDQAFATAFDTQFDWAVCTINKYDLVPTAWATLASIPVHFEANPFYPTVNDTPSGPGPTANPLNPVGILISNIAEDNTNGNVYVQPVQQPPLNAGSTALFTPYPQGLLLSTTQQFEVQVGFQHANNTYLTLLDNAPNLPPLAPVVASVSPTSGSVSGGTSVTIYPPDGLAFSPDCVADFGIVPAPGLPQFGLNGSSMTVTSPPGVGTVDIRVTNMFGTSPAMPVYPNLTGEPYNDQFTFTAS